MVFSREVGVHRRIAVSLAPQSPKTEEKRGLAPRNPGIDFTRLAARAC
jgi:hypothetical protein